MRFGGVGGVYGFRISGYFLRTARAKSKAIKEIVQGNELCKQLWPEQADRSNRGPAKTIPGNKENRCCGESGIIYIFPFQSVQMPDIIPFKVTSGTFVVLEM